MDSSLEHKRRKTCKSGEIIFRQGEAGKEMYVVHSGKVRIFRNQDGHETDLATLGADDFFGEMALFDNRARSASAQAVGETELRVVTKEAYDAMQCDPIIRRLLTTVTGRLRSMDDAFERLNVESGSRREYMSARLTHSNWLT